MSNFGRCPTCGQHGFLSRHVCEPLWYAVPLDWLDKADDQELWQKVYAQTAKEAAEIYAENEDRCSAEFTESRYVAIRSADGDVHRFEVNGELDPIYTASLLEECWPGEDDNA